MIYWVKYICQRRSQCKVCSLHSGRSKFYIFLVFVLFLSDIFYMQKYRYCLVLAYGAWLDETLTWSLQRWPTSDFTVCFRIADEIIFYTCQKHNKFDTEPAKHGKFLLKLRISAVHKICTFRFILFLKADRSSINFGTLLLMEFFARVSYFVHL